MKTVESVAAILLPANNDRRNRRHHEQILVRVGHLGQQEAGPSELGQPVQSKVQSRSECVAHKMPMMGDWPVEGKSVGEHARACVAVVEGHSQLSVLPSLS